MIRAIAIDIDGTLTDEQRRLELKTIEKIREIEALKIPVILATGNVLCFAEAARFFIGTSGPLIAENGGVVEDPLTKKVYYLGDMSKVREAFNALLKKFNVKKVVRPELRKTEIAIQRSVKVAEIKEALKNFDVSVVDTKFAIHIKDPKVNKGNALKKVAGMLGLKLNEIAAIGDSENDREMLEYSGYSISVGERSLKDVSDYVTSASMGKGGEEALKHVIEMLSH